MSRAPTCSPVGERPTRLALPWTAILLLLLLPGCAVVHTPPSAFPSPPAQPAESPKGPSAADEALLAEHARRAAESIEAAGPDAIPGEDAEQALSTEGEAPDQESGEGEPEETEPSPLDELEAGTPEVPASRLDQERGLIELGQPAFDIPMEINDKVVAWVDYYTTTHRERFQQGLARSGRYLPMIRRIFAEEGLPQDLGYMAHVESAYKPNAYSRAKAKGIFQFIASTGRRYGLKTDYWIDERSDPEKATRAAAAYLKDLYGMFGDWYLALAAYNAGEGKIQRSLARTGATDFWGLVARRVLRKETNNYVPAILAATLISKDPAKFGFEFEYEQPDEYESVQVEGSVHLNVLARCAASDLETMKRLNPALRRARTSPGITEVRVPRGAGPATIAELASVPASERAQYGSHVVQRGETLGRIARRYGTSVASIQRTNHMGRRTVLRVGESLLIPDHGESAAASGPRPAVAGAGTSIRYRVQPGDTLYEIARRHGTTANAIAHASGIPVNRVLRVGQRLTIPSSSRAVARSRGEATHAAGARKVHTVRRGETLARIAERYRITVDELCYLNNISSTTTIYPGTRLTVRTP